MLTIRDATAQDATKMADLINEIIAIGGTTAYSKPLDAAGIIKEFVAPPLAISCFVAYQDDKLVGFQALQWCDPDWPGDDALPDDWAIIATYVDASLQRTGTGSVLMAHSLKAAHEAGALYVDATIRKENTGGQTYYSKMGFEDYRSAELTLSKRRKPQ